MLFSGGGSDNPFATSTTSTPAAAEKDGQQNLEEEYSENSEEEESESERLAEELALKSDLATLHPSPTSSWVESATRYPALYLNTVPEPSSSTLSKKLSAKEAEQLKATSTNPTLDDADLKGFATEGYEKMLLDGIDSTFERFLQRVQVEPRQAVRYEFGGEPIAFHAKGKVYDLLWPKGKGAEFSSRGVPPCGRCGGERVFEAQLMPNLINLLKADTITKPDGSLDSTDNSTQGETEQDRRKALELALGRHLPKNDNESEQTTFDARTGLVWSTAFIFTCSNDCCPNQDQQDETWAEEVILAQFEDEH